MQYDLVFYPNKNEKNYEIIKGFDYDTTLAGIINFCNKFENYNDLVTTLFEYGAISAPTLSGVFKIHSRASKESKPRVFAKGLTYKNESHFYNISYLQSYYAHYVNDIEFIKTIIDKHYNFILEKSSNKTRSYLYEVRHALKTENVDNEINLDGAIRGFVISFCERKDSKNKVVTNYPNLMLLARMAIAHERQILGINPNIPIDDTLNIEAEIDKLTTLIDHYSTLINGGNVTQEEFDVYEKRIGEAKDRIEILREQILRR